MPDDTLSDIVTHICLVFKLVSTRFIYSYILRTLGHILTRESELFVQEYAEEQNRTEYKIEYNMATDSPSAALIVIIVLAVCATHYGFPIIHYTCIGAFKTKRYGNQNSDTVQTNDVENQYVVSKSESKEIFKSEKSISRVLSMHFTFWAYVWIVYFAVTTNMGEDEINKYVKLLFNVLGYIHLPVFVLFLWVETFLSWESDYLSNMLEEKSCKIYIKELMEQKPIVTMAVVAWHFETKSRTVTYTNANGQTTYGTETYVERVNDHEEVKQFPYIRWEDVSPDPQLLSLDAGKVTRIKMLTTVLFGDTETEEEFNRIRTELEENAKELYPSSNVEFARGDAIPGLEERVCAYWESDEAKWWTSEWVYVIMSLLLLTWFYRIAFTFVTQSTCYRVVKKIYTS